MYLYGGPGSQQVKDQWKGQNYWWFQMLAQQGYIVACVDNRGTGARGADFKKVTYQDASEEKLAPAREFEKVCKKHNVEMGAAALQFSLRDKRIASTICGVTSIESIEKNLKWANCEISLEFWEEVLKLPFSSNDPESDRIFTPG